MIWRSRSALFLAAILALPSIPLSAQVVQPGRGQQRNRLEQRLRQGFQQSIQAQLGLEPGQMRSIQEVLRSFDEERSELSRAQASVRLRLRDSSLRDIGEPEARNLLQEMVDLQERELDLYRNEQARLLELMNPVQLVRFYQLRDQLGQRVQQLRQGRGQGGGPGGMRAPGGAAGTGGGPFR